MQNRAPAATITAILVDDEKLASEELAYQLRDFPDIEIAATASNDLDLPNPRGSGIRPNLPRRPDAWAGRPGVIRKLRGSVLCTPSGHGLTIWSRGSLLPSLCQHLSISIFPLRRLYRFPF
jgi:hypothetical protein